MLDFEGLLEEIKKSEYLRVKFSDVCTLNIGKQLNKMDLLEDGKYPVINGGVNPSGFWNEFNVDANTISISQGGASAGFVQWNQTPFWAGAHCYYLTSDDQRINYRFLYYFLKFKEAELMKSQYGAGIPALKRETLKELDIILPPLEMQNKIVHFLDMFTALITALRTEEKKRKEKKRKEKKRTI